MTDEPKPVYLFRSDSIVPGSNTVVCAAPADLTVAAFGGGGHLDQEGVRRAFGGNALYRNDETGQTFLAVWGARNASRFRTALRCKATIVLMREPPPARLAWASRDGERPPAQGAVETISTIAIDDLFARALIGLDEDDYAPMDHPTGRVAILRLHRIASREVLDAAREQCSDADPLRRRIGADVLAQLGHSRPGFKPVFVEERVAGLMSLLDAERDGPDDPQVLSAACVAFGHLHAARAIPTLLALRLHPQADVRHGVAFALGSYDVLEAIEGLIALSADPVDHVRDWATFGLGQQIKTDTPAIRAALRARLDDPYIDARNEAIEGLATRGDPSVISILMRELSSGNVSSPLLDAATALASPNLCDALRVAAETGLVWQDSGQTIDVTQHWQAAMRACGCDEPSTNVY